MPISILSFYIVCPVIVIFTCMFEAQIIEQPLANNQLEIISLRMWPHLGLQEREGERFKDPTTNSKKESKYNLNTLEYSLV